MKSDEGPTCNICGATDDLMWREDVKLRPAIAAWIRVVCPKCAKRLGA